MGPLVRGLLSRFRRLSSTRRVGVALVLLVVLIVVVSALTPAHRSGHRPRGSSPLAIHTPQPSVRRSAPGSLISTAQLAQARAAASRFVRSYLPLAYGRAPAKSLEAATPALLARLTRESARETPVEGERRPRLLSLAAMAQGPDMVLVTALVDDGGITTYALRITVRDGLAGWLVSDVDDG
jgi:hypothetical protein